MGEIRVSGSDLWRREDYRMKGTILRFVVPLFAMLATGVSFAQVEPHCSDGDCELFAQHCLDLGRVPMCLNAHSTKPITVCVGVAAASELFAHHPDACRGICTDLVHCNDGVTTQLDGSRPLYECYPHNYQESPEWEDQGWMARFIQADDNEDGWVCATYRCTMCPPKAKRCNLVCHWIGPVTDYIGPPPEE
jgi:hypothetical protein